MIHTLKQNLNVCLAGGVALLTAGAMAMSFLQPDCPIQGSGEQGVLNWAAANCPPGECDNPAATCNGQFTIELLSVEDVGNFVTFTYEICQIAGQNALSHWGFGVGGIDCLGDGFDIEDLLVGATLNGEAIDPQDLKFGFDPTTGLDSFKFDVGVGGGSCNVWSVTFDTSVLEPSMTLGVGCVVAATKAGNQDITRSNRASPGYACVEGPVCLLRPAGFCEDPETAFAFNENVSHCFTEYNCNSCNRWGWTTIGLPGGVYEFDLYAGAAHCDPNNGTFAGTVTLDYDETSGIAIVTYEAVGDCEFGEVHIFIGNEPLPRRANGQFTTAPGQYTLGMVFEDPETEFSAVFTDLSGDIHFIAHAVVCCGGE